MKQTSKQSFNWASICFTSSLKILLFSNLNLQSPFNFTRKCHETFDHRADSERTLNCCLFTFNFCLICFFLRHSSASLACIWFNCKRRHVHHTSSLFLCKSKTIAFSSIPESCVTLNKIENLCTLWNCRYIDCDNSIIFHFTRLEQKCRGNKLDYIEHAKQKKRIEWVSETKRERERERIWGRFCIEFFGSCNSH